MTPDALHEADALRHQLTLCQNILNKHIAVIKKSMSELSAADQATVITAVQAIHTPVITALHERLTALSVTYTAPAISSPTTD